MKKPKFIPEFDDIPTPRVRMPELPLERREGSFDEVELGLTQELALAEASRCLSCRRCIGCGLCLAECDPRAIVYDQAPEERRRTFAAVLLAAGSGCFDATSKPALAYATSPNVVTTVEIERMLSPTGPFGGRALRPGDGTPPERVAFVQCVGSREEGIGANYCSTTCCNTALKLADDLVRTAGASGVTFFHRGMRPFGRRGEALYRAARDDDRVEFIFGEVKAVTAGDCTEPVIVAFDAGEGDSTAEFDLVVLSIGSRASSAARSIARRVRAPFNKFGYVSTDLFRPVPVGVEDVPVAGGLTEPVDAAGATVAAHAAASAVSATLGASPRRAAGRSDSPAAEERPASGGAVVWVCEYGLDGGGPGASDIASEAGSLEGVAVAGRSELACAPKSVAAIADAVGEQDVGRILVVGCHPKTHGPFWRTKASHLGDRPVAVDLVEAGSDIEGTVESIRKRLSGGPGDSDAPAAPDLEQRLLVVGGGASGLAAAEEAARRGVPVTLVARGDALGGRHSGRHSLTEGVAEGLESLVELVGSDPSIDVVLESAVANVEDGPPGFVTGLAGAAGGVSVRHGAVVVATESEDYESPGHAGRGKARVLTQPELARDLAQGQVDAKAIVVIQCVGSRTPERPYCSRTCCAEAMANVLRIKEQNADSEVTVLHKGVRVWGFDEELFADAVDLGVRFVRVGEPPEVSVDGALEVTAVEADGGEELTWTPDLVVLSTGILPSPANGQLAKALGITLDGNGFFVPVDEALRPVDTVRPGIFVCGTACWPVSVRDAVTQARAAAAKACLFLRGGADDAR